MTIAKLADWFIADDLKQSEFKFRKARIILFTKLFFLLLGFMVWGVSVFIDDRLPFPFHIGIPILLVLIATFRYTHNILYSGNFLAALFALFLVPMTITGGGLYSDNLIWLSIVPILAFFLADIRSGLIWTAGLLVFQYWLLTVELDHQGNYIQYLENVDPKYYFFSFSFFFIFLTALTTIFKVEQNKIIETLNQQKADLARQKQALSQKAYELELAQKSLENSNRELGQFAYVVSHDLKAPLRSIHSFSQLLQKDLKRKGLLDEENSDFLNFITGSVSNMTQLIADLLTYARTGNENESQEKQTAVQEVIQVVLQNLQSGILEHQATIIWQDLPEVVPTTKTKLVQLLQNLISNAIKYRRLEVNPIIKVSCIEKVDCWQFSVEDNGQGIAPENQSRVFDIFVKLDAGDPQNSSGIGLATCKKIVEQAGGKIWVDSTLNQGSAFCFTLMKNKNAGPPTAA